MPEDTEAPEETETLEETETPENPEETEPESTENPEDAALPEEETEMSTIDRAGATLCDLWLGSQQVTSDNMGNIPVAGGTASFDPSTNTLTLNGVTGVTGTYYDAQIYSNLTAGLNIKVINGLTLTASSAAYGIYSNRGNLTITGNVTVKGTQGP